ncbi:MAG: YccF domain-containing protein [Acidimicrobiales bacterium]
MRTLLNLLWFFFSGVWLAIGYAVAGVILCLLIITIPFGVACFRLAGFVIWPFGRSLVPKPGAGAPSAVANVIWFVLVGLWMALAHLVLGLVLCLTIIGIPLGLGNFKLAAVAIAPLGKEIVPTSDPRAQLGAISF